MKLYLCRHGETEWTLNGRHTGRTDLSLTENGKMQAEKLHLELKGIDFKKIYSSPLKRAKQTASPLNVEIDSDLAEFDYGDYEGLTTDVIHQKDPDWNLFQDGCPNGETLIEVGKRADRFLKKIENIQGNVAVFSHGHFLRILAARFLKLDPKMGQIFSLSVASISILGFEKENPVVMLWNL